MLRQGALGLPTRLNAKMASLPNDLRLWLPKTPSAFKINTILHIVTWMDSGSTMITVSKLRLFLKGDQPSSDPGLVFDKNSSLHGELSAVGEESCLNSFNGRWIS